MKIIFDEDDAMLAAKALAKSRGVDPVLLDSPWQPGSTIDQIHADALRVVAAFRNKYGPGHG